MMAEGVVGVIVSLVKSSGKSADDRKPLFEKLMANSYKQAFQMAYRFTSNRSEAEDLLQETYIRAFRYFHRFDETMPFTAWLYRIMTNLHIDNIRKISRLKTVSFDQPAGDSASGWEIADTSAVSGDSKVDEILNEPLQRALQAMTGEFRTAVVLADIEGMSYEEIAVIMDTSVGTVRSRIHRGRKQIREHLEHMTSTGNNEVIL
ncbi:MAG: sigma-70 family RNA polymerase sigma factor [Fimbriimonadaceae bacterium]